MFHIVVCIDCQRFSLSSSSTNQLPFCIHSTHTMHSLVIAFFVGQTLPNACTYELSCTHPSRQYHLKDTIWTSNQSTRCSQTKNSETLPSHPRRQTTSRSDGFPLNCESSSTSITLRPLRSTNSIPNYIILASPDLSVVGRAEFARPRDSSTLQIYSESTNNSITKRFTFSIATIHWV